MTALLDVNVLISLAWPNHVHHVAALTWFNALGGSEWATTPITETGFVRVSCSPALGAAITPTEALSLLGRIRSLPSHAFLADDVAGVVGDQLQPSAMVTHRQITDGHLLAVAMRHGAQLATFDRGIVTLAGGASANVLLIPAG